MLDYKWQFKHGLLILMLILAFLVYVFNENCVVSVSSQEKSTNLLQDSFSSIEYFETAKGKIHLNEIITNVFKYHGYTFIKNDLIPVLKKTVPKKCIDVFFEWEKIAKNGLTFDAPKEMSNHEDFLLNNYSFFSSSYLNEVPKNEEKAIPIWEERVMNKWIRNVKNDPLGIPVAYPSESVAVYVATKYYSVKGKVGAVIGTQVPWVEAYVLSNGAKNVTTIDYQRIEILHPKMSFLYAPDLPALQKLYHNYFDFIVSFSSVEHSGLGRYGDPLDPIGDIREMNKIHCMLKPKGLLFFSVPIGSDSVVFNVHRSYGRMRLAMMFEGFQILEVFFGNSKKPTTLTQKALENGFNHYLFVLQKIE